MNADMIKETLARISAEIVQSQNLLSRRQKTTNERCIRNTNAVISCKLNVSKKIESLKQALKNTERDNESAVLTKKQLENQIVRLADEVEFESGTLDDILRCLEKKKEQLKALESVCATTKRTLEEYVAKNEDIKDRLKSHIETNERNLGVKIRILEEDRCKTTFQVTFDAVSPSDPDEEFVLVLTHDKTNYEVVECRPALMDFTNSLDKLNSDGDLSCFLVRIRNMFQNLCKTTNPTPI